MEAKNAVFLKAVLLKEEGKEEGMAVHDLMMCLEQMVKDDVFERFIARTSGRLVDTFRIDGGKLITCGNGGSMCDAMHLAEELMGRFSRDRQALPAICLSDPSYLTCAGNDYGFDEVFARGIEAFCTGSDILIVFSTSGNSENLVRAVEVAKQRGTWTIGILGKDGGRLAEMVVDKYVVPSMDGARIQEVHTLVLHCIVAEVEQMMFGF